MASAVPGHFWVENERNPKDCYLTNEEKGDILLTFTVNVHKLCHFFGGFLWKIL